MPSTHRWRGREQPARLSGEKHRFTRMGFDFTDPARPQRREIFVHSSPHVERVSRPVPRQARSSSGRGSAKRAWRPVLLSTPHQPPILKSSSGRPFSPIREIREIRGPTKSARRCHRPAVGGVENNRREYLKKNTDLHGWDLISRIPPPTQSRPPHVLRPM